MPDKAAIAMSQPQVRIAPALSATSDQPDVNLNAAVTQPEATQTDPDPKPPVVGEQDGDNSGNAPITEPDADGSAPGETDGDNDTSKSTAEMPPQFKAQITRQRGLKRAAEARAAAAEQRADQLSANLAKALEGIESLTKAQAARVAGEAEANDPRPVRDRFDTPDAYDSALIEWAGRRAALVAQAEAKKSVEDQAKASKDEEAKAAQDKANKELADAFSKRTEKFTETHPDYDEIVNRDDLMISIPMAQYIMNAEDGNAVAYYLGKNGDEAERISKLSPALALAEMGKISVRLSTRTAPVTPKNNIRPLRTGSEAATVREPAEMSMDEYGAYRQRKLDNDRRTRMGLAPLN